MLALKISVLIASENLTTLDKLAKKLPNLKKLANADSVKKKSADLLPAWSQPLRMFADSPTV